MTDPILSGQLLLGLPIALLAGVIAFASPCVLPLVPGYLGLVSSLAGGQDSRRRMLLGVALFIAGFTAVFVAGSIVVGASSTFLLRYHDVLLRVLGGVLVVMGLVFIGQLTFLQKVWKPRQVRSGGMWAAPIVGVVFAVGWTPCIGPTFAAISVLALDQGSAWQAAVLGLVYSLGLGLPFLVLTIGFGWASRAVGWVRRNIRVVNIIGGSMLVVLGLLMLSGVWTVVSDSFQGWVGDVVTIL